MNTMRRIIAEAIDAMPQAKPAEVARVITDGHGAELDAWNWANLTAAIDRAILRRRRAARAANQDQGWLPLPEFEHIPAEVQADSLEEFRARIAVIKRRIKFYAQARRSDQAQKADERELREMLDLEPKISPFFISEPAMTVGQALILYKRSLETPATKQRREAQKSATREAANAKKGRT